MNDRSTWKSRHSKRKKKVSDPLTGFQKNLVLVFQRVSSLVCWSGGVLGETLITPFLCNSMAENLLKKLEEQQNKEAERRRRVSEQNALCGEWEGTSPFHAVE